MGKEGDRRWTNEKGTRHRPLGLDLAADKTQSSSPLGFPSREIYCPKAEFCTRGHNGGLDPLAATLIIAARFWQQPHGAQR